MHELNAIREHFKGLFISSPEEVLHRFEKIKAVVFDWDGVFNGGYKDAEGSSPFSEVDAMGTNLLRFNFHLRNERQLITAIISGEHNKAAQALAQREHFHAVYNGFKHKVFALEHFCEEHKIHESEVVFVFDDVLDFSMAERCGLRVMVNRASNPMLVQWAQKNSLIDYLTAADGMHHAVRETVELLTAISGLYDETIGNRAAYSTRYQRYLSERNETFTNYFTIRDSIITRI